jgi:electron transfer flavoprotein alpha subunit
VIAGSGVGDLASQAAGAAKVWVADDPALEAPLAQPRVDVIAKVVEEGGYDTVLFAASVLAADIASGLAARLDAGLNWDLVDLVQENGRSRREASCSRRLGHGRRRPGRARRRSA